MAYNNLTVCCTRLLFWKVFFKFVLIEKQNTDFMLLLLIINDICFFYRWLGKTVLYSIV